jgi:glyoxylase-like metal-dependent hydrolase (beta-lactamase superfamily II)
MRLTADVALVGGGPVTGFGISSDFDAHVYLLDGGNEFALIDCGMGTPLGVERVSAAIEAAGIDPHQIDRLFLTHYHTDHAGGAAVYRERLGLRVSIAADVRQALELPNHEMTQFAPAQRAGLFPAGYDYGGCPVDDPLSDGDARTVGRLTVHFVATPGHCAGHGSYLVSGGDRVYLFAGDAVFSRGRVYLQAIPDCDLHASVNSIRRLDELEFAALLPGHGSICIESGSDHVRAASVVLDRLGVPETIF